MIHLMQSHDYMKAFAAHRLPEVVRGTKGTDRAVYYTMLLMSHPENGFFAVDLTTDLIMVYAGVSMRTCERALRRLQDADFVSRIHPGKWELV
jgi:hypothetical protein